MGTKIDDSLTVWGCYRCDIEMSTKPHSATEKIMLEWENKWMMGIIETHLV